MKGRAIVSVGLLLVVGLALVACDDGFSIGAGVRGSGTVVTESRDVTSFDEIVVLGSGDVIVNVDGTESLTIEAEDNLMPLLTSNVRDGRLELGSDGSFSATKGIIYRISAESLEGVEINGSGDVTAAQIDAASFDVTINGSGNVEPAGSSDELTVEINGSGDYKGEDLIAATGAVRVSGSGSALVNVTDSLDVDIAGSGDVAYMGDPTVTEDISGSGDVSRR